MIVSADLHIHSALSPCADDDMTPGNIIGMANINNISVIAITDHNIALNVYAAMEYGKKYGVLVIPGMELETSEEIHVICLFNSLSRLLEFQKTVFEGSSDIKNRPSIFGNQYIYNEEDEIVGEYDMLLLSSTKISIDEIFGIVNKLDGIAYPAHVDRDSYSVLSQLGTLPYGYKNGFVEISKECNIENTSLTYPELKQYKYLKSSDAHRLESLTGDCSYIECCELSINAVIDALKNNRII